MFTGSFGPVAPRWAARRAVTAALAALTAVTAACTGGPGGTGSPGSAGADQTPAVRAPAPMSESSTVEPRGAATCTEPLVLARHHALGPFRLGETLARRWAEGDGARRVVRSIAAAVADRQAVAVLRAGRVDPRLRVAVVAGVHPLRRPHDYPLQVPARSCPPRRGVTLTVVGDVMLGRRVAAVAGDRPGLQLEATGDRLRSADVTVGNLESTLSRAGPPTQGGDSFAADPSVAGALRRAGFDVLGLANNHAGDFGTLALRQTVRRLRSAGLSTFGAGANLEAARRPAVVRARGTSYGFVGFNAIGETPEAGPRQPGAVSVSMPPRTGPLDRGELARFLSDVRALDRRVDVVVVLPHWGTQYTEVPEPVQWRVARRLVAAGADLVVGGHPHWVQGAAMSGDALVVHSLGNFVFDMDFMAETMVGLVLETTWWGGDLKAVELRPYRMDGTFTPRFVPWDRAGRVLRLFGVAAGPAFRVGR
jgi:hypothetical protein